MAFDRKQGIGASDARLIMDGEWLELWQQKTGKRPPPDYSDIFRVQLGLATETFHLAWVARRQKIEVRHGQMIPGDDDHLGTPWFHKHNTFMFTHLDGWDHDGDTHIELKHSHSNIQLRECAAYYMAQLQHQLAITCRPWCWFSVIPGNGEPMTVRVDRNDHYIERLIEAERMFWWHVESDVQPEIIPTGKLDAAAAIVPEILVGGFKEDLDMSRSNTWAQLTGEYVELKPSADRFTEVCAALKTLIPPDRKRAFGHGVQVVRDKAGRLSVRKHGDTNDPATRA